MKFDFNRIKRKDIEKLLLEKEMNIAAADGLFNFCFYSRDEKIDKNHYLEAISDYLELNLSNNEDKYFFETRIKPAVKEIKEEDYNDNYFRQNIKPQEYKDKEYELKYLKIKPYQAVPYDDVLILKNYVEVSQIGYFSANFTYLAVVKDDVVWMSTDPNEINTMKDSIKEAKGRVLAFGLGLGYFPIMCASKKEVIDVYVIEKDQKIIDIFKKHILPLFKYKEKIHIIHDDAFHFARGDLSKYDYLFIDIWHNPEDGLPLYLKFKKILKNKGLKVSYWLEKSILAMLRRCLLTVVEESLEGHKDKDYLKAQNEYDEIINSLYFKTKNISISSFNELMELLSDKSLLKLI